MRSVIDSEVQLIVAVQHAKSGLFSNFHFTCFEWIIHDKLFRSQSFNLQNLCAAGTEEGPILLISKLPQALVPVCLLCVHKCAVTDIIMSHQIDTFLSVAADGSIAGWHCQDGTCCFVYENLIPPGEAKIILCDTDSSSAWFWIRGKCASLVDLKSGKMVQYINMPGLMAFSILTKHSNILAGFTAAVMVTLNSMITYQMNVNNTISLYKEEDLNFAIGENYYASPNGIIQYNKKSFEIYIPNPITLIFIDRLNDIQDDDSIAMIDWKNPDTLLIGTYKGFFRIYKMQIVTLDSMKQLQVTKTITFSYKKCCIFSNIAYKEKTGVIFASASATVMCLSEDEKLVKLTMPQNNKLCCIPDSKGRFVIQSDFGSSFQMFDWSNKISDTSKTFSLEFCLFPTSQSVDFRAERMPTNFMSISNIHITALACHYVNHPDQKLQIIAGASDGKMYFFWENSPCPTDVVNALVAPIVGISFLPIKQAGRMCLIAIGGDGSFCLFKWTKLAHLFATNILPIVSIGFIETQQLIVVQKIDNSYHVYEIDDPLPLSVTATKPSECKTIWSRVSLSEPVDISSTLSLNIPGSSLFYSVLEVSKLQNFVEENGSIPKGFRNEVTEILTMMSPMMRRKSMDVFHLKAPLDEGLSFVLIGYRNLPTFFYPMYKLSGPTVFDTSPYNACLHYISYTLMSEFLGSDSFPLLRDTHRKICSFLSVLTQFLYVEDEKVQRISTLTCIKAIGFISEQSCRELVEVYIQYFDKKNLADYDKYLMAILMVGRSEFVPQNFHKTVFEFLRKMADSNHVSAPLALTILLSNIEFWSEFSANKKTLLTSLIKYFYRQSDKAIIEDLFHNVVGSHLKDFYNSINDILAEFPSQQIAGWICQLCSKIAKSKPLVVGTSAALVVAHLETSFSQYYEVFESGLRMQQSIFSNKIAYEEQTWAISTDDGTVHVFKNSKFLFKEKLFDGRIQKVSIGPKALYAAAVSENQRTLKVFGLKRNFFVPLTKQRVVLVSNLEQSDENFIIEWTGKDSCRIVDLHE